MEGEYRNTAQKKELCLWEEDMMCEAGYYTKMLQYNRIPGVLSFTEELIEGRQQYRYEIGTKRVLTECREFDRMNHIQLENLVRGIVEVIEQGREYLIHERDYVLKPEYIFLTPDLEQLYLCCYPSQERELRQQLSGLFEYLLSHIDYQDFTAVEMAYELYMKSQEVSCGVTDLLEILGRHAKRDGSLMEEQRETRKHSEEIENIEERERSPERQTEKRQTEDHSQAIAQTELVSESTGYCLRAETLADSLTITSFPCYISSKGEVLGADDGAPMLGKTQAKISMQRASVYIEDMKSENGTFVNGRRIAGNEIHKLSIGDSVMLADRYYRFIRES